MAKREAPAGELRFEVPFDSPPPQLTSTAVGLPRLLHRSSGSYRQETTLLDSPDGRLLRAGIQVAHRVRDGAGEWRLAAPSWAPHLPEELVEPVGGNGDLPASFANLLRPLSGEATLVPAAAMICERDEWALRGADGEVAAVVVEDKVRVRRGEVSSRYREITISPRGHLSGQQREYLLSAARAVGATVVTDFPSLQQRLGAPATGITSFPKVKKLGPEATLEEFVTAIFAEHLGNIVRADLDRRRTDLTDVGSLNDVLWSFGRDLRGLAPVLEPAWREEVERTLRGLPFESPDDIEQPTLKVIDALVAGVRAPRLGDLSQRHAALLLFERAQQAAYILADRCRALSTESPDDAWQAALRAAQQLEVAATVLSPLMPKSSKKLLRRLDDVLDELRNCGQDTTGGEPEVDGLSPAQAYQLGIDYERNRGEVARCRADFIERWPTRVKETRKLLAKAEKKQHKQLKKQQKRS